MMQTELMQTQQQALLGVLGGMGPMATVDFLGKLTRITAARRDQDHLPWLTFCQPGTPDRTEAILAGNDASLPFLTKGVAWLARQGVKLIVVPCNTSHFWFKEMEAAAAPVPMLHIADAVVDVLRRGEAAVGVVAVLASRGTADKLIYHRRLQDGGFEVFPLANEDQLVLDRIIGDVKGGQEDRIRESRLAMRHLLERLACQGVKAAILGCTELPLALDGEAPPGLLLVDSSVALAQDCLLRLGYALAG